MKIALKRPSGSVRHAGRTMSAVMALCMALLWPSLTWAAMPITPLTIDTVDGRRLNFTAELALTPADHELGLMNRRTLAANAAMLFDFGHDREIAMWMHNTLIPLDMLFLSREGVVKGIVHNATPMSDTVLPSPGPVRAVLEVQGGLTDKMKIQVGDRVLPIPSGLRN